MPGPLHGVRVIEVTQNVMGPYAAQILGDMGAEVIKIEPPEGDMLRSAGPARNPGMGSQFLNSNRNKRSIAVDLKTPGGDRIIRRLIERGDVFICSMRPAAMARLGLDFATLSKLNPRLVHASAFGYGQRGPYAAKPAYDDLIQGALGMPVLQAASEDDPRYFASNIVDRTCGMALASAVGMALFHREVTGQGQAIELPMFETMAQVVYGDHMFGHTFVPPMAAPRYKRMIDRRPYKTKNGYLALLMVTDGQWQRFFGAIGTPEKAKQEPFATRQMRSAMADDVLRFLAGLLATRTTEEWLALMEAADVPAMPIQTPEAVFEDPHMREVGFFREIEHPTEGRIRSMDVPTRWSASPPEIRLPAPRLGQHTRAILEEAGFDTAAIAGFIDAGAALEGA